MNNFKDIKLPFTFKIILLLVFLSIITGVFIGSFCGSIFWAFGWPEWFKIGLIISSLICVVTWLFTLKILFYNKNLKREEINHTIIFKERENDSTIGISRITTVNKEELENMAYAILEKNLDFTVDNMIPILKTRTKISLCRQEFLNLRFLEKKGEDNKQGVRFTNKGLAMLRAYRPAREAKKYE